MPAAWREFWGKGSRFQKPLKYRQKKNEIKLKPETCVHAVLPHHAHQSRRQQKRWLVFQGQNLVLTFHFLVAMISYDIAPILQDLVNFYSLQFLFKIGSIPETTTSI